MLESLWILQEVSSYNEETGNREALTEENASVKADSKEVVVEDKADTWVDPEETKAQEGNEKENATVKADSKEVWVDPEETEAPEGSEHHEWWRG